MTEKLLIIGGTGFIGKNLAMNAVESGYHTTVLSLHAPKQVIEKVDYIQADVTNFEQLQETLSKTTFDYVVNLSGYIHHSSFLQGGRGLIDTHFVGVQNILQLLDWGVLKRFVQIGSSDEYGNNIAPQQENMREAPISSYSLAKTASTQLLQMLHQTENLPVVIFRLFLVYGPGQDNARFLPQIIKGCFEGKHFPVSAGEQLRDFCFIEDISTGILMALKNNQIQGEVINLASGAPVAIHEVIATVRKLVGRGNPEYGKVPYRAGENMALYADTSKAKKLLAWEPKISLEEGIKRTIGAYQNGR